MAVSRLSQQLRNRLRIVRVRVGLVERFAHVPQLLITLLSLLLALLSLHFALLLLLLGCARFLALKFELPLLRLFAHLADPFALDSRSRRSRRSCFLLLELSRFLLLGFALAIFLIAELQFSFMQELILLLMLRILDVRTQNVVCNLDLVRVATEAAAEPISQQTSNRSRSAAPVFGLMVSGIRAHELQHIRAARA